jgi:hypothetical protein
VEDTKREVDEKQKRRFVPAVVGFSKAKLGI